MHANEGEDAGKGYISRQKETWTNALAINQRPTEQMLPQGFYDNRPWG